jgi:hypothetical protein
MTEQRTIQVPLDKAQIIDRAIAKGRERMVRVGDNHGRIERILKDDAGEDVVISQQEFGYDYVMSNLGQINLQLEALKAEGYLEKQIKALEDAKAKFLEMREVLDGTIEERK